jgi:hypothetical protein
MMMKKFLSALVVAVLSHLINDAIVATPAYAESLDKNVLAMHAKLDELCRGGSRDDPATQVSCDARLNFEQTLAQLGYCYGIGDRAHAAWHSASEVGPFPAPRNRPALAGLFLFRWAGAVC